MVPQLKGDDDELEYPHTSSDQELRTPTSNHFAGNPLSMASSSLSSEPAEISSFDVPWSGHPNYPSNGPPHWVTNGDFTFPVDVSVGSSTWTTTTKVTPLGESVKTSQVTTSYSPLSTDDASSGVFTSSGYGNGPPDWYRAKQKTHSGGLYAAAAITPVVVLALIGGLVFFCMRKRKRQRQEIAANQKKVQEMKMQPRFQPTAQPYMASPSTVSPRYAAPQSHLMPPSNPSVPAPIILGPMPSGVNRAYFTGIDTSDAVSVMSASNLQPGPPNPFSDNDSLAEPPPPYRPRSTAPPSVTNSSRHSSFRAMAPPTTSRTHLIEPSPFEDPEDDDVVSDLSGPTAGRDEDAMSVVSELSYQIDPVGNRSSR